MVKIELSSEQQEFLKAHAGTINQIPLRWFVRTSDQCWGVGDTLKDALANANVRFATRQVLISVVTPDWELDDIDGGLRTPIGIHDKGIAIRDYLSPTGVLELAREIFDAYEWDRTSDKISDFILKHMEDPEGNDPTWETLRDKKNRRII